MTPEIIVSGFFVYFIVEIYYTLDMFNFLHSYIPSPILFSIGSVEIHWYAFLMVVGGLIGLYVAMKLAVKHNLEPKIFEELVIWFAIGAVIGARVYYVIYAWEFYSENLFEIFQIWNGGMAVHGVMIGGFIATVLFAKWKKVSFWKIADIAVVGLVVGQVIGRVGNYFNQEIFGKPTDLPWGIPIEIANRPDVYLNSEYFHPTFLYESVGSLVILFVLLFILRARRGRGEERGKKGMKGNVFLIYLILYSVLRFWLEFLRTDFSPMVFDMRWAQLFSIFIIFVAIILLIIRNKKYD